MIDQMPLYKQLPNGCGLSTFLMLINPKKNENIRTFFENFYQKIDFLVPQFAIKKALLDEYKWSVVLNYILLKCLGNNEINAFLKKSMEGFENHEILMISKLQEEGYHRVKNLPELYSELFFSYFDDYLINPYILRQNLYSMKTDLEIKILFQVFGGYFVQQEQDNPDGTGSLYFTIKDFKFKSEGFKKKISILEKHLKNNGVQEIPCIALNLGFHWVAVSSLNGNILEFYDPASSRRRMLKINKRIPESLRFYLFRFNLKKSFILKKEIKTFLDNEASKELESIKVYTTGLLERANELKQMAIEEIEQELEEKEIVIDKGDKMEIKEVEGKDILPKSIYSEDLMDRIRKRIKEAFRDYSKL